MGNDKGPFIIYARKVRGGSSINLLTKRGLPDFLFFFLFLNNTFRALGTNGTSFAGLLRLTVHYWHGLKLIKKTVTISTK